MSSISLWVLLREGTREGAIIHPCYWHLHCLYTSKSCCKTLSCGDGIEGAFYDHLSWMVLSNVKVRKRGYAILESTRLWLKTQLWPNDGTISPDYVINCQNELRLPVILWKPGCINSQCWKFTQQNSLVSKVQQTTGNQEMVIKVCRTSRFAQTFLFLFLMAHISGGLRNTGL